jgi:hypothetical protein
MSVARSVGAWGAELIPENHDDVSSIYRMLSLQEHIGKWAEIGRLTGQRAH